MLQTLAGFLQWLSIATVVATPATLCMIRFNEIGDNPFRNPGVWYKVAIGWWVGLALSCALMVLLAPFGPILLMGLVPAITGWLFDLFFHEGYWRSVWWAFGTMGILSIVIPLTVIGYSLVAPRFLGILTW